MYYRHKHVTDLPRHMLHESRANASGLAPDRLAGVGYPPSCCNGAEPIGHNLSLRRQLKTPSRAVPFDALIDVSPLFGHHCSWVFEHGSWQRFGETWPTGLPRLMTVDDLAAHATDDDDDDDEDDVPVVSDEEEGSATRLDDGSENTTDHDDDDAEDDAPVVSDDDDVEEVWEDDF